MLFFGNIFTLIFRKKFYKNISNNEEYKNTYCYGKHTKFSNDCIRWFVYNISKDVVEYNFLCYEYETDAELLVIIHLNFFVIEQRILFTVLFYFITFLPIQRRAYFFKNFEYFIQLLYIFFQFNQCVVQSVVIYIVSNIKFVCCLHLI